MNQAKGLTIAGLVFWLAQLATEIFLVIQLLRLNMLPGLYLTIVLGALALMLVVTGCLCLIPGRGEFSARRVIGWVLALLMVIPCVIGSSMLLTANRTLDAVTQPEGKPLTYTSWINVYVRKGDPAQTITDAKDYTFGIMKQLDRDNTDAAIDAIEQELGSSITLVEVDSAVDMAQALYDGTVQALIFNSIYPDLLEDSEEYANFTDDTRVIYEFGIEREQSDLVIEQMKPGTPIEPDQDEPQSDKLLPFGDVTTTPFAVYLSGSDTRNQKLARGNSDVNIILIANPKTKQVLMINTPRDYYIPNPAGGGAMDKLTHCGVYGIDCSVQALSDLYGVNIAFNAQINFTGFETLVDAVGGVSVYSDTTFSTGTYSFVKGYNEVDGAAALAFARDRHHQASGDNARGIHQMALINAIIQKMTSGTTILSHYTDIMNSMQGMFVTSFSSANISDLVKMQLSDMSTWDVKTYAVTGDNGKSTTYSLPRLSTYVMIPHQEKVDHAIELIRMIGSDQIITDADLS